MIDIDVVIGANYGDEGKGRIVDHLAHETTAAGRKSLVVLHNGGPQHGHTVVTPEGYHHVFKHIGAGAFAGADTFLAGTFLVNPMELHRELDELDQLGIGLKHKIYISTNCRLTTHMDMMANQIREQWRESNGYRYGSCGMGIWETILRNRPFSGYGYGVPWKISDSLEFDTTSWEFKTSVERLQDMLNRIRDYYLKSRFSDLALSNLPNNWGDLFNSESMDLHYMDDFLWMVQDPRIEILTPYRAVDVWQSYDQAIFETGQGLLLDGKLVTDQCHNTPSNTDSTNAMNLVHRLICMGFVPRVNLTYVTRSYLTRHGNGIFFTECSKDELSTQIGYGGETNQENPFQGHLRYAPLNLESLLKRLNNDHERWSIPVTTRLAITHMDEMANGVITKFPSTGIQLDSIITTWGPTRESTKTDVKKD